MQNEGKKIKKPGERVDELEDEHEPGIIEEVAGQLIPGLGGIVKILEKSSPEFRKRIAQTDEEIKHRIETGWNSKPEVKYGISIGPLASGRSPAMSWKKDDRAEDRAEERAEKPVEREPIIDIFEEKEHISVIAELPGVEEKDIGIKLKDNILEISAGKYSKTIKLPSLPGSVIERTYKSGILQLKIERKDDAGKY